MRSFLSSLVLHHLDDACKRGLFARLFDRLEPGGALLFADVVQPRTDLARRCFARSWADEVRSRSSELHGDARAHEFFERERWNVFEHPDPKDKPSTLPELLRWMEEAGF